MPQVSVILPTFNEAGNIIELIKAISQVLTKEHKTFEVIVVDDNSPDGTAKIVRDYAKHDVNIKLFVRLKDHSLGKSIGLGVSSAVGEVIVGMDADFNHPPELIPRLLAALQGGDLAVASRFIGGGGMSNHFRYWTAYCFNITLRVLGFRCTDNASGFYAIRRKDLIAIYPKRIYYGYGDYHLRLTYYALKKGYRLKEVPIFYGERKSGASKSRLFIMAYSYFKEALRLRLSHI